MGTVETNLLWYLVRRELRRELKKADARYCEIRSDCLVCTTNWSTDKDFIKSEKKELLRVIPKFLSVKEKMKGNYTAGFYWELEISLPK